MQHEQYILRCLELAANAGSAVYPNPLVGSVIVSQGKIIAEGFHQAFGEPHAEVNAISKLDSIPADSTLYVNLEPCSHHGKTPPCAELIIDSGIKKVVIGAMDINPKVAGKGIAILEDAGIEVVSGILVDKCLELNKRFYVNHKFNRPYIILKWAETSDGFIARDDFSSKWISSEESRVLVHQWRSEEASILVGTNTAKFDNPSLTVRHLEGNNPIRIVLDRELKLSKDLSLFNGEVQTIVVNESIQNKEGNLEYLKLSFADLIPSLLSSLWERGVSSVFVEGGAMTLQSFIDAGLWDEARQFVSQAEFKLGLSAPKISDHLIRTEKSAADTLNFYQNRWLDSIKQVL